MSLTKLTACELLEKLNAREVSSVEATSAVLQRIDQVEPSVGAYISTDPERALKDAAAIDEARANGKSSGPLAGLPVAVKDNMCTKGRPTTCASKILEPFKPPYNAHVVEKLEEAGAIIIGKANCDEFAMGSSTENSALQKTRNPWSLERIPGGSSGGSAAAVASGEAFFALGSDTGGSIRQPAAHCGCVGMKPTYGLVSRYGLVAFASSLDQIGPLARDVRDAALVLEIIAGHDRRDSTSSRAAGDNSDFLADLDDFPKGIKVGVPKEYAGEGLNGEVSQLVKYSIDKLREIGCEIVDVSLPHTQYAVATYYIIATAEASSNLGRYDGVHYGYRAEGAGDIIELFSKTREEGFGQEVKRRIMLGTYVLSAGYYDAYYFKALKVRRLIREDYSRAFEAVDVIIGPTSPTPAFKIGEMVNDPLAMYLSDVYTISTNLAGIPAISIPCGLTGDGLPVGVHLQANVFKEKKLLQTANALEAALAFKRQTPAALREFD